MSILVFILVWSCMVFNSQLSYLHFSFIIYHLYSPMQYHKILTLQTTHAIKTKKITSLYSTWIAQAVSSAKETT